MNLRRYRIVYGNVERREGRLGLLGASVVVRNYADENNARLNERKSGLIKRFPILHNIIR